MVRMAEWQNLPKDKKLRRGKQLTVIRAEKTQFFQYWFSQSKNTLWCYSTAVLKNIG